jgi:hypothetical protein
VAGAATPIAGRLADTVAGPTAPTVELVYVRLLPAAELALMGAASLLTPVLTATTSTASEYSDWPAAVARVTAWEEEVDGMEDPERTAREAGVGPPPWQLTAGTQTALITETGMPR